MEEETIYMRRNDPTGMRYEEGEIPDDCREKVKEILEQFLPLVNVGGEEREPVKETIEIGEHLIKIEFENDVSYEWGELGKGQDIGNVDWGEHLSIKIVQK